MMRTVTVQRYEDLSYEQWKRVASTAKRHVGEITGQSCEIGIGNKYAGGYPSNGQVAVRVYLPKKLRRVPQQKCVPENFLIRLRRNDGKYDLLNIRSDVESIGDYVLTSARAKLGRRRAATGFLLRWNGEDGATEWGFATVGHLFEGTSLRAASVRVNSTTKFRCRLFKIPAKRKRSDLAVMRMIGSQSEIEAKLKRGKLIKKTNPPAIQLMTVGQVLRAAGRQHRGRTFSPESNQEFTGEEVFPDGLRIGTRTLDDCIRVGRSPSGTFKKGTSGSAWRFGTKAACIQVGGKATDFREGIGQPFQRFMPWIHSALGSSAKVVAVIGVTRSG